MENYEIISEIGKGSFGSVSKVKRKSDGKLLVWKELNYGKMTEKEKQQLVSEVNILRELKHPNVVRYFDRIIDKEKAKIYIVMEYCEGGDMGLLLKKCKKTKDYIGEDVIWKIFMQMVLALNECHNRKGGKILHRDLKPGNVFLDSNNNVKLGDFGLARMMSGDSQYAYTHVGTPYYMSPEQIKEAKYNEKSDIWSAGCVLYEITALKPPFEASNHLSLAMKIKGGKFDRLPSKYSEELQRVVKWMLKTQQQDRPIVDDLLNLPQISMRLREKRLKDNYRSLKMKDEKVNQKEKEVTAKEKELAELEKKLEKLEKELEEKENTIKQKEDCFQTYTNSRDNPLNPSNLPKIHSRTNSIKTSPESETPNKIAEQKPKHDSDTALLLNKPLPCTDPDPESEAQPKPKTPETLQQHLNKAFTKKLPSQDASLPSKLKLKANLESLPRETDKYSERMEKVEKIISTYTNRQPHQPEEDEKSSYCPAYTSSNDKYKQYEGTFQTTPSALPPSTQQMSETCKDKTHLYRKMHTLNLPDSEANRCIRRLNTTTNTSTINDSYRKMDKNRAYHTPILKRPLPTSVSFTVYKDQKENVNASFTYQKPRPNDQFSFNSANKNFYDKSAYYNTKYLKVHASGLSSNKVQSSMVPPSLPTPGTVPAHANYTSHVSPASGLSNMPTHLRFNQNNAVNRNCFDEITYKVHNQFY